jgi:hypothetical protein
VMAKAHLGLAMRAKKGENLKQLTA